MLRVIALTTALMLFSIVPLRSDAAQIGPGDFGAGTQTTTFDGLGLPPNGNPDPLLIDGHTITTDDGFFRYLPFNCVANECIFNNQGLGFIEIALGSSYEKAGAFVSGNFPGWIIRADFFDSQGVQLGSFVLSNPSSAAPLFAGWQDPAGVALIRFVHLFQPGRVFLVDDLMVEGEIGPPLEELIEIDIKPGSFPNAINPISQGLIPVAILGFEGFDVNDVDVTTLAFGPAGAVPFHAVGGHLGDVNDDGFVDLLSHYATQESGILPGETDACVTGQLLDGTPFDDCDDIVTVPMCGLGFELALLLPPLMWLRSSLRRRRGAV